MGAAIALNVVVIVLIVIFAAAAGNMKYNGLFAAWVAFCATLGLSLMGWAIAVIAHFILKFW